MNNSGFELFFVMSGIKGSGIPLAFCYIETIKKVSTGAKQQLLENFLTEFKNLEVNSKLTLIDKDVSETNTMLLQNTRGNANVPGGGFNQCLYGGGSKDETYSKASV